MVALPAVVDPDSEHSLTPRAQAPHEVLSELGAYPSLHLLTAFAAVHIFPLFVH